MARGFRRRSTGDAERFVAHLNQDERAVVVSMLTETLDLIDPDSKLRKICGVRETGDAFETIVSGIGIPGHDAPAVTNHQDPALQRLFPVANRTDTDAATEFRRITESGLRMQKVRHVYESIALLSLVDELKLDRAEAEHLVVALTDVRLVLADRLGLRTDADVDAMESKLSVVSDDDPDAYPLQVYDFLTWLQETLASAMYVV